MNILVTSISKKIPLLNVARNALSRIDKDGYLFGADSDKNCTGRYFCDFFWLMPVLEQLNLSELKDFCRSHDISVIIPTRDGELHRFAEWAEELEKEGISTMVSAPDTVITCLDKLVFYQILKYFKGLSFCHTVTDINFLEEVNSFVVKERFGAASNSIAINVTLNDAIEHADKLKNPVFQPFICGQEYSVDLYRSRQGINIGVVARSRDLIVAGESQISTTVENSRIEQMCCRTADILDLQGHVVFQGIIGLDGNFQIIECNPRFGGASTLSIAAGLDSFFWFLQESQGQQVIKKDFIKKSPLKLIRYPQDLIIET